MACGPLAREAAAASPSEGGAAAAAAAVGVAAAGSLCIETEDVDIGLVEAEAAASGEEGASAVERPMTPHPGTMFPPPPPGEPPFLLKNKRPHGLTAAAATGVAFPPSASAASSAPSALGASSSAAAPPASRLLAAATAAAAPPLSEEEDFSEREAPSFYSLPSRSGSHSSACSSACPSPRSCQDADVENDMTSEGPEASPAMATPNMPMPPGPPPAQMAPPPPKGPPPSLPLGERAELKRAASDEDCSMGDGAHIGKRMRSASEDSPFGPRLCSLPEAGAEASYANSAPSARWVWDRFLQQDRSASSSAALERRMLRALDALSVGRDGNADAVA